MIKLLFAQQQADERIVALQRKFGLEALLVATGLLSLDFIYRILVLNQGFSQCWDLYGLIILPLIYYALRSMFGGAMVVVKKNKVAITLSASAGGMVIGVPTIIALQKDLFFDNSARFAGFIVGVLTGLAVLALLVYIRNRIMNRHRDDDEE